MVFDNLKIFLAQKSAENQIKKEEKQVLKLAEKERKNQLILSTVSAEEDKRWGPKIEAQIGLHDYDDEHLMGRNVRAIVHRYQRVLGIGHLMNPLTNKNYLSQLRAGYFEPSK